MNAVTVPCNQAIASAPTQGTLGDHVARCVRRYLDDMGACDGDGGLFLLVMNEVEEPLLREVMDRHGGNQSRAAQVLGINRATLRKKLLAHGLL